MINLKSLPSLFGPKNIIISMLSLIIVILCLLLIVKPKGQVNKSILATPVSIRIPVFKQCEGYLEPLESKMQRYDSTISIHYEKFDREYPFAPGISGVVTFYTDNSFNDNLKMAANGLEALCFPEFKTTVFDYYKGPSSYLSAQKMSKWKESGMFVRISEDGKNISYFYNGTSEELKRDILK